MSSNSRSYLSNVVRVEHFSCIRLRSLRMKLIFEFLGRADWWCTNSGFFAGFFQYSKKLSPFVKMVTLKSSRDRVGLLVM